LSSNETRRDADDAASAGGIDSALARVLEEVLATQRVTDAAAVVADLSTRELGADAAGVVGLARENAVERLGSSGPLVADLDRLWVDRIATPFLDPPAEGEVVDLEVDTTTGWPDWRTALADRGVRTATLVGLPALPGHRLVLDLYRRRPGPLPGRARLRSFARHAGAALRQVELTVSLRAALDSRGLIGQAQGILMERYGLGGEAAMSYLRRHSQQSQLKVRELAAELVAQQDDDHRDDPDAVD